MVKNEVLSTRRVPLRPREAHSGVPDPKKDVPDTKKGGPGAPRVKSAVHFGGHFGLFLGPEAPFRPFLAPFGVFLDPLRLSWATFGQTNVKMCVF